MEFDKGTKGRKSTPHPSIHPSICRTYPQQFLISEYLALASSFPHPDMSFISKLLKATATGAILHKVMQFHLSPWIIIFNEVHQINQVSSTINLSSESFFLPVACLTLVSQKIFCLTVQTSLYGWPRLILRAVIFLSNSFYSSLRIKDGVTRRI